MTAEELAYVEKVQLPEWEGYGWGVQQVVQRLIDELRKLNPDLIYVEKKEQA